jgi:hypothetical protein
VIDYRNFGEYSSRIYWGVRGARGGEILRNPDVAIAMGAPSSRTNERGSAIVQSNRPTTPHLRLIVPTVFPELGQ